MPDNRIEEIKEALEKRKAGGWNFGDDDWLNFLLDELDSTQRERDEIKEMFDRTYRSSVDANVKIGEHLQTIKQQQAEIGRLRQTLSDSTDETVVFAKEIYRLHKEIEQHRGALGYPMPGGVNLRDDIVNGIAEALEAQLQQSREEVEREASDAAYWKSEYERAKSAVFKWGAECDRAKAENERLQGYTEELQLRNADLAGTNVDLKQDNEKLRGELEQVTELYEHAERDVSRRAAERDEARQVAKKAGNYAEQRNKWMSRAQLAEAERDDYRKALTQYAQGLVDPHLARRIISRYEKVESQIEQGD